MCLSVLGMAQTKQTVKVEPWTTYNLRKSDSGNYRSGLAFDFVNRGKLALSPLVGANTYHPDKVMLGGGLTYTLYDRKGFAIAPMVSYTGNVESFRKFSDGKWGLGVELRFRW